MENQVKGNRGASGEGTKTQPKKGGGDGRSQKKKARTGGKHLDRGGGQAGTRRNAFPFTPKKKESKHGANHVRVCITTNKIILKPGGGEII